MFIVYLQQFCTSMRVSMPFVCMCVCVCAWVACGCACMCARVPVSVSVSASVRVFDCSANSIMSIMSIQVFDSSGGHFAVFDSPRITVAVRIAIAILAWSLVVRMAFGNSYNVWERVSGRARGLMRIHGEMSWQI